MTSLVNRITEKEAAVVRGRALHNPGEQVSQLFFPDGTGRLFLPIGFVDHATGRAACRECGNPISKGESCIYFGFDPYGGRDSWGKLARAYLHIQCPDTQQREERT